MEKIEDYGKVEEEVKGFIAEDVQDVVEIVNLKVSNIKQKIEKNKKVKEQIVDLISDDDIEDND